MINGYNKVLQFINYQLNTISHNFELINHKFYVYLKNIMYIYLKLKETYHAYLNII